jgi:hypothetical protein
MILSVPAIESDEYPSLGPLVWEWIERNLVFGPGDLQGLPARLDDEKKALIYRAYQVFPPGTRDPNGKSIAGRRRFRRVGVCLPKGSAKTEWAAWITAAELHPDAPVRFDHFDGHGKPWGRGLPSVYIPMVAFSVDQSEDLAYGVLRDILERSRISSDFDIGFERITRAGDASSKAQPLASAPGSREGALTTFQHWDETWLWASLRLRNSRTTMLANLTKRLLAEPWGLETTTAYIPGQNSVAEQTAHYAEAVAEGKIHDSRLFYFHRYASEGYDLGDRAQLRAAIVEASGPNAAWRDIEGICDQWQDPEADKIYLERVYLNRPVALAAQAFNVKKWGEQARPDYATVAGAKISLGFDGSLVEDATALVATELATGFQWPVGIWEKPEHIADWFVPKYEVDAAVEEAFSTYEVVRMYSDPSKWDSWIADWAGRFGAKRVVEWPTVRLRLMATALKAYANAIESDEVTNNGDRAFGRHIGNAQRNLQTFRDDDGSPLWLIEKERPGSPNKIDAAMAGCLSWRARLDAIAAGALEEEPLPQIYLGRDQ